MIDCLLIVVSYRSAHHLAGLLASVPGAVGDLTWRVLIVNNDPDDDLSEVVAAHPQVQLVQAGANLGYAGGINRGTVIAPPSRWTVFLNPDVRLEPGALVAMATAAGDDSAVVPAIRDEEGHLQPSVRREPSVLGSLGDALFGDHWPGRPEQLSEMVRTQVTYQQPGTIDWATGAALLVPTVIVDQIGLWDEGRFFLYSEETDYCRRLRDRGTPVWFRPEAVVRHTGGGSGTSDDLHALQEVNRVRYFRKWHGVPATTAFAATAVLNNLLRVRRPQSRTALRALLLPRDRSSLPGGSR